MFDALVMMDMNKHNLSRNAPVTPTKCTATQKLY